MLKVVLATANLDKVAEIAPLLSAVELLPRPSDVGEVDENGESLEDNARLKALALVKATGLPAVADDTGLQVDALGGAPGVHSARFAGENASYTDNVAKLLQELSEVPPVERRAVFCTVALLRFTDSRELIARGEVLGSIAMEPIGDAGFGYDPVFVPDDGDGRTFAQMTGQEKNNISHRGRAFRRLNELLSID